MTTISSTTASAPHHPAFDDRAPRTPRPTSAARRAFALGAILAALVVGIAWLAVASLHAGDAQTSAAGAAAGVQPAAAGTAPGASGSGSAAGTATGGSGGTAVPAAATGGSYPHGQDIATLQRDLGQLNYYESPVDGVAGPATIAAIKDFQRANGLPADGVAGPDTLAKIERQMITGDNQMGPSGPPAKPANTPAKPANTTPVKPDGVTPAHGQSANTSGGAAAGAGTASAGA